MRICQLQNMTKVLLLTIFCSIFLNSCANNIVEEKAPEAKIEPRWQKLPLRFAHRDMNDGFIAHPFFDIDPRVSYQNNLFTLRYFLSTPVSSGFQYDIDLYSGQLVRSREFCPQKDVWEFYNGNINKPNFTQGFAPRVFDENNRPMRVVILTDKEALPVFKLQPSSYNDARIVGSVIIEQCETFPCGLRSKWKASQVLVGMSSNDPKSSTIEVFNDLKKSVDWDYTRAILVNMNGHHKVGDKTYPSYRISKELSLKDTWEYFEKNSKIYNNEKMSEMVKWRDGCLKMYDSLWEKAEKIRTLPRGQTDEFLKLFKEFYTLDSENFYACQELARPATIIENHRRLWFFAYIQAFVLLEKNGFYFSCQDKAWAYNPKIDETRYFNNQVTELNRCRARDFEKAFDQAINGMSLMRNQTSRQFRFVEYDNMRGGSHQKIYGWIKNHAQNYSCQNSSLNQTQSFFDIFPQDVVWENFKQDDEKVVQ